MSDPTDADLIEEVAGRIRFYQTSWHYDWHHADFASSSGFVEARSRNASRHRR